MSILKKLSFLLAILVAVSMILAACGSSGNTSSSSNSSDGTQSSSKDSGEKPYIALVSKGFQHQFWQSVMKGAEKAAKKYNVKMTFVGPSKETKVKQQLDMLKTTLNKNPDVLGFAALDSKASIPLLKKYQSQGIPVVGFDSGVESDIPVTTVATNNIKAAGAAADHMAKLIGKSGKVAIVAHSQTSLTGIQRRDGFKQTIKEKYPDIEIVQIAYTGGDHLKSANAAKAMIQSHPDLEGIYATNEGTAIGVVLAVKELEKKGDITIVGFDSGKQQIKAIKSGLEAGAITQNPIGIGFKTVEAAVKILNGKGDQLPEHIGTGFYWYDQSNIDKQKIRANLYK